MVVIMIFFIGMITLSPITAVIPGIYGLYKIIKGTLKVEKNYWNYGLLLLFLWYIISSVVNRSILSFGGALLLLMYFSAFILGQNYFKKKNKMYKALKYQVIFTGVSAVIGIIEKVVFVLLGKGQHRVFSLYGNPNMAGAWFGANILILIYLKSMADIKNRKKYDLLLVLITVALMLTESSGAFISLIISTGAYLLFNKEISLRKVLMTILSIIFLVFLFGIVQKMAKSITVADELVGSFNSRYDIWVGSIEMFRQKPFFGWGSLGTLIHGAEFMYHNGNVIHSHNMWLSLVVGAGAVGLVIYLYIKLRLFKDLAKIYNRNEKLGTLFIAVNVMIVIQGLVDCPLYAPQVGMLFIFCNSMVYNLANGAVAENAAIKKVKDKKYKTNVIIG